MWRDGVISLREVLQEARRVRFVACVALWSFGAGASLETLFPGWASAFFVFMIKYGS